MKILLNTILPNALKLLLVIMVLVISMVFFIASINEAMAASPKINVSVTSENITLGDVFDGINTNADYILAPAPMPGETLIWDARTLNRIARAFDLKWNARANDKIQIKRLGNIVTEKMIKKAILSSFDSDVITPDLDLEFLGSKAQIILPYDIESSVTVVSSSFNRLRNTFSATLRTPDDKLRKFTGISHRLVSIPVLKTALRRGDRISKNMIKMIDVRDDYITDGIIIRRDELVGMTPRKILHANTPVKITSLIKPVMVKRGDLVTMKLKNGGITITSLAKALETGRHGDIIRLTNVGSKRTLEAQVTGLREATVF